MSACRLCTRPSSGERGYCKNHEKAFVQLQSKYPEWKVAFENISWERYLETIIRLKESGELAKAVAKEELRLALGK